MPNVTDTFDRSDRILDDGWVNGSVATPGVFEPIGIRNGWAVIWQDRTRPGTYQADQWQHPPSPPGTLYSGIGCAWKDIGSTLVEARLRWSGVGNDIEPKPTTVDHIEATPLLYVKPDNPLGGFGVWPSYLYGQPVMFAGYIGSPPELFDPIDYAAFTHVEGTPRDLRLVCTDVGEVKVYLDGTQLAFSGAGTGPIIVDASLTDSTLHGFALDAHLVLPQSRVTLVPGASFVSIIDITEGPSFHDRKRLNVQYGTQSGTSYIRLSRRPNPDLPPVVMLHGWPSDQKDQYSFGQALAGQVDALVASGYAIYMPFTGSNWGSATCWPSDKGGAALEGIDDVLVAAAADGFNTSKIHVYAASMGGCNALNWAWRNPTRVASMFLIAPMVDFASTYDTSKANELGVTTSMRNTFGSADRAELITDCESRDPVRNTASLTTIGPKTKIVAISGDEVVPYESLVAFTGSIGAELVATPGSHFYPTTMSGFKELDVPAWFEAHQPRPAGGIW